MLLSSLKLLSFPLPTAHVKHRPCIHCFLAISMAPFLILPFSVVDKWFLITRQSTSYLHAFIEIPSHLNSIKMIQLSISRQHSWHRPLLKQLLCAPPKEKPYTSVRKECGLPTPSTQLLTFFFVWFSRQWDHTFHLEGNVSHFCLNSKAKT